MRIWRHATQTSAQRILVYSPDTDVYMLFICSGCDYVSYFSGLGKVAFLNTYQHAPFISGNMLPGILSEVLLRIGYQMRRNECPHKHQCGATGYAHAGCLKCGDMHQNLTFLVT